MVSDKRCFVGQSVGQIVFCRTKITLLSDKLSDKPFFVGQIVGQTVFCRTKIKFLSDKWYNVVGQIGKGVSDK